MDVDLNLLRCFQAVAERRSITNAASVLHLSQPAISLQLKKLEQQIGQSLFDRHNRGLILTRFGKELLIRAQKVSELSREVHDLAFNQSEEVSGVVKVGSYTTATSYLLSEPVAKFLRKFPKITVAYCYDPVEEVLNKIINHELDCAVVSEVPINPQLTIEPLFSDELVYAVSAKRKESSLNKIMPKDLSKIEFLSYPLRFDLCYKLVEKNFGRYLADCRVVLETTSFDTIKQMLLQGAGGTFIPSYLIKDELKSGALKQIHVGNIKLPIEFSFVVKSKTKPSRGTLALQESLLAYFRK
jgi:DNA-binding transcriptional LysR family regulator